ncbi:MAG: hypothetical protein ACPGLV_11820 [Bacteroidia bacterium]
MGKIIWKYLASSLVTLVFFVSITLYSGIGIVTIIGNAIFSFIMFIISVITIGVIEKSIQLKSKKRKFLIASGVSATVGICMISLIYWLTNPDYRKNFFPPQYTNYFEITRAREFYIAFEYELYIKAQSIQKDAITEFLKHEGYRKLENEDIDELDLNGPYWFPNETNKGFKYYELNSNSRDEIYKLIIVSDNKEILYGFYLAY